MSDSPLSPVTPGEASHEVSGSESLAVTAPLAAATVPSLANVKMTPMFAQYLGIKEEHPGSLLFFRMGDFYELFFEDAVIASRELQIALTSRSKDSESPVPMCGVPWHAVDSYTSQLVNKGFHVAICDQVEDPKTVKGLVKREVTKLLTPGTAVDDANLDAKSHNFLGALFWDSVAGAGGFAWVDVSTGQWSGLYAKRAAELWQWVQKLCPRELLLPDDASPPAGLLLEGVQVLRVAARSHFDFKTSTRHVLETQGVQEAGALGLHNKPELMRACGALVIYLGQTQRRSLTHLHPFKPLDLGRHLIVDELTERNLEIFVRLNGRKGVGTLWHVLDETLTPMGGRLLEERLRHPWRELDSIRKNQQAVAFFGAADEQRRALRTALDQVYDLERLSTRISLNRANPRDYIALRHSLAALPAVLAGLTASREPGHYATSDELQGEHLPEALFHTLKHWDNLEDTAALLHSSLVDSPPNVVTDGGLFKAGYHAELDVLLDLAEHGEQKLQAMLEEEQAATGLNKLKLGYNRVFGYYFEITRAAQSAPIPEHFIRRQTLANGERFTTVRLKELEEQILSASDKRKALEYNLFQQLRQHICDQRPRILFVADLIALLDYWQALGEVARRQAWCAPELDESQEMLIREGRHPVVESVIGSANFVANDLRLDDKRRLCLLTGPNMAGKSTVLRQTAIICLLAQMGSFVPARQARLGLVDRIFSRVGASDNLAQGQSTFMVEMMETARILRQSTKRSLIILDEIGRGTSTYDGLALAWAVVEELTKRGQGAIRTLFATHYHELTALEGKLPHVFTMNIAIREHGGEILFMHRLVPGPSDRSYGVEVARLAGVPMPVVQRAREILADLERTREGAGPLRVSEPTLLPGLDMPVSRKKGPASDEPPCLPGIAVPQEHPLLQSLRDLDPDELTPMQALKLMNEWKLLWGK